MTKCDYVGVGGCETEAVGEVLEEGGVVDTRCQACYDAMWSHVGYEFRYFNSSTRSVHAGDMATRDSGKLDALVAQLRAGDEVEAWYREGNIGVRYELEAYGDAGLSCNGFTVKYRDGDTSESLVELRVLKLAAETAKPAWIDAPGVIVNNGASITAWRNYGECWRSTNDVVWDNATAEQQWRHAQVVPLTDTQDEELFR